MGNGKGIRIVGAAALGALGVAAWALREMPAAFGARRYTGTRARRVAQSPQYRDGKFRNSAPTRVIPPSEARSTAREFFFGDDRQKRIPAGVVPIMVNPPEPAIGGLHLTWYGHASTLVEIEGRRVLIDPVWSERVSPTQFAGPRRLHPVPVPLERLPELDAVLISHDHYDHLDLATVRTLVRTQSAPFVVPLGVGAHLERWRVPAARIIELDWSDSAAVAGLRLTATAAQHFSGRLFRRDGTLWASWVIAGPTRSVFYTGDSGYFPGYAEIGERHGPFDAALVQIGAYATAWPDIHMTPEEGVAAHQDLRAGLLVPVHWATFKLSLHGWAEPVDRIWRETKEKDVRLAVPRPGERIDVDDPPLVHGWWQSLA